MIVAVINSPCRQTRTTADVRVQRPETRRLKPVFRIDASELFKQIRPSNPEWRSLGNTASHWYVVQIQPHRETAAADQLRRQGFEIFFPRRPKTVRHARRLQHRLVGYFPGYLFVKIDLKTQRWRAINGTLGVIGLIMAGDRPAHAPCEFVESLRASTDERGVLAAPCEFAAGQHVRIQSGPFADAIGTMERLEGGARVRILIDLLGGAVPIVAAAGNLAPAC